MHVVIVGAGIVGVSVACALAGRGVAVTVLDRDGGKQRGSTAFAPGFVGVYNDAPVLTELARASVDVYRELPAFAPSGGLELATSSAGAETLAERVRSAQRAGLRATLDAPRGLPSFVDDRQVVAVARYDDDGVATPHLLRAQLRAVAESSGAQFVAPAEVVDVRPRGGGWTVRTADGRTLTADQVVLAAGIWGPGLAGMLGRRLPLYPVAHPYVYARPRAPRVDPGPFVRWPEHHVYARAHGDTLGIGSYDHRPVPVAPAALDGGAGLAWDPAFDAPIASAQSRLHPDARFTPAARVNGVFAMTPDNLPFLGPVPGAEGAWIAQAIWVTHAGGAALALSRALCGELALPAALACDRFEDAPAHDLETSALRLYRDIYAHDSV
ncbi:NAD(P)/FAD-dependent oxidoreductase [Microbacterium testaceum]|uniref:NAD(P)/FAD-dependent oxidoreductase n=1 Tax=Microbacterium testaceum TaxID=2033 RepID=UPI0025B0F61A|nr:FAD-dependent oxidoreductase [Microbacterium testaceum]WJS92315.1 FAD-binding oxidoreductase [Microbacterium testaceum]